MLTAPINYSAGEADCEIVDGAIDGTIAVGDVLALVIATSGATGSQGAGLIVEVWIREGAD